MASNDWRMVKILLWTNVWKDFNLNVSLKEEEADNKLKFVIREEAEDIKAYADALFMEKQYLEVYSHFKRSSNDK